MMQVLGHHFLAVNFQLTGRPYHIMIPYHTIPYHTVSYRPIQYRTIPYRTVPYHHTVPYHNIPPYHTIPYHTVPCHTMPTTQHYCFTIRHALYGRRGCSLVRLELFIDLYHRQFMGDICTTMELESSSNEYHNLSNCTVCRRNNPT